MSTNLEIEEIYKGNLDMVSTKLYQQTTDKKVEYEYLESLDGGMHHVLIIIKYVIMILCRYVSM